MKKIELFKRRLVFKVEKIDEKEREYRSNPAEILSEKIIYIVLFMALVAISSQLFLLSSTYNKGDVMKKDIVAPRNIKFNDRLAKDTIVKKIINESKKSYIHVLGIEEKTKVDIKNIYSEIKTFKNEGSQLPTLVSKESLNEILNLSKEEIDESKSRVTLKVKEIYTIGVLKENELRTHVGLGSLLKELSPAEIEIVRRVLKVNFVYDEEETKRTIDERILQVEDVITEIEAGSIIAKKGNVLDEKQLAILRAYGIHSFQRNVTVILAYLSYLVAISVVFYQVTKRYLKDIILKKNLYRALFLIIAVTLLALRVTKGEYIYLLPIDAMLFLLGILLGAWPAIILGLFVLVFAMPIINFNFIFFLGNMLVFLYGISQLKDVESRTTLINTCIKMGFLKMILVVFISSIMKEGAFIIILEGGAVLLSGIFSGMLTIALLPYFERTFNILTTFKLKELGELSHPLLKELSVKTPGTFNHSTMVANLSENAAEAIGADSVFSRVAALYHDIGKLKRPNFYVENQRGGTNPHGRLNPTMSNLIIQAHTKDGVELAKGYGIPKEIRDVMVEHQGTTLLAYFYNKAKQTDSSVEESNFRYSGPKPRTKESAIIMLADSIEAAVRSLDEKSPTTIDRMIRKIIKTKIEDNQLSEANLTFKEIELIIGTFTNVLMGIHHSRLKYPGQK